MELCDGVGACVSLFNDLAVSLGILLAIFFYSRNQFIASYENLNDRFLDFMQLQVSYPALGTDTYDRVAIVLSSDEDMARRKAIFEFLCSLLERAYLYLNDGWDRCLPWKKSEWTAWEHWIHVYCQNPNFTAFWRMMRDDSCFSASFVQYMNAKIAAAT